VTPVPRNLRDGITPYVTLGKIRRHSKKPSSSINSSKFKIYNYMSNPVSPARLDDCVADYGDTKAYNPMHTYDSDSFRD
jgi:hypothetical protein